MKKATIVYEPNRGVGLNLAIPALILFLLSSVLAQPQALRARLSSVFTQQCQRAQNAYEVEIRGRFEIENASTKETVLVPKRIDEIQTITAARSLKKAKGKIYSFVMNQEISPTPTGSEPRLEDFIILRPGEKGLVQMSAVVPSGLLTACLCPEAV